MNDNEVEISALLAKALDDLEAVMLVIDDARCKLIAADRDTPNKSTKG